MQYEFSCTLQNLVYACWEQDPRASFLLSLYLLFLAKDFPYCRKIHQHRLQNSVDDAP